MPKPENSLRGKIHKIVDNFCHCFKKVKSIGLPNAQYKSQNVKKYFYCCEKYIFIFILYLFFFKINQRILDIFTNK
jgi:hypothetical protein